MEIEPYLLFDGRCQEAADFYRRVLDAEVTMLMHFKDSPDPRERGMVEAGSGEKVMHMSMRIGDTTVMASGGRCLGRPNF
jgi:PhnB protein